MGDLARHWRRYAMCAAAFATLGSAQPSSPDESLRGGAATLAHLPSDAGQMARMAPGRSIVVLSRADFNGDADEAQLRSHLARYLGAADLQAIDARRMASLIESINTQAMTAMRLDSGLCLVTTDTQTHSAQTYAGALAGIPAARITRISGNGTQWRMAALFHEAGHCAQSYKSRSIYDFTAQLQAERDADQRMLDVIAHLPGYDGVARDFRAMRALAAVHFSGPGHMTAAALVLDGETPPAGAGDAQRLFNSMAAVNAQLKLRAGQMMPHRADVHLRAFDEEIEQLSRFTARDQHARHPVLSVRAALRADLQRLGLAEFAAKHAQQQQFINALYQRSGDLLREERGNADTYRVFARAALALHSEGYFAEDPLAARFLQLYSAAVSSIILPTAPSLAQTHSRQNPRS